MTTIEIAPFDYAALPTEARIVLQQKAGEIHERMRRAAQDIVEIGERLIAVQHHVPRGTWERWLQAEFQWSDQTARRFIHVARVFGGRQQIVAFAASALYALAAPSTPEEARQDALARAEGGERITHQAAKALIATHTPPSEAEQLRQWNAGEPIRLARIPLAPIDEAEDDGPPFVPGGERRVTTPGPTDLSPAMRRRLAEAGYEWQRAVRDADGVWLHDVYHRPTKSDHRWLTVEALEGLLLRKPTDAAPPELPEFTPVKGEERPPAPEPGFRIPALGGATYDEDAFEQVAILVDDLSDAMQAGDRGAAVRTWLALGETLTGDAFSAEEFAAWAAHWSPSKPTTPEGMLLEALRAALADGVAV